MYEQGAEDLAKLVADSIATSMSRVEQQQYVPFKDGESITIYVFNDREHYARFSHASILSRGSSAMDEVYMSGKFREKRETLPNILVHELSHVHIRQYTGSLQYIKDVPGWFLEGIAVLTSSGGGAENVTVEQAETAIRKDIHFEPHDSGSIVGHKSAHDYGLKPHMYYRQASLFVEYLQTSNREAFKATFVDILNGVSFRDVWTKYYGHTVSELWSNFVTTI